MRLRGTPTWAIELQASTYPTETWVDVYDVRGRRHRYVDKSEAQEVLDELVRVQPAAVYRLAPL